MNPLKNMSAREEQDNETDDSFSREMSVALEQVSAQENIPLLSHVTSRRVLSFPTGDGLFDYRIEVV